MPKRLNESPSKHVELIRRALREYEGEIPELAACTGIPANWLHKFSQGIFCDPGAGRVETLARALGYEVSYRRARAALVPKQRKFESAAIRQSLARQVYGDLIP